MTLIERINRFINAVASDIKSLYANKVNKTDVISVAQGGTGATTLAAAQTALGVDKVVSANTRLTTAKQTFPNVYVDSNGQLQKTKFETWLDHAKMYNGLQPNGSFQMGDATGWHINDAPSQLSYIINDFPFGAQGSLKCVGGYTLLLTLDKIAVNPYMKYRYSGMFKYEKVNASPTFYCGLRCWDVDGNEITFPSAYHYGNTVTTLAQDLKQGDTKVYLSSLSGWVYNALGYQRGFKFYNYTDSRGYLYDPSVIPYSRYFSWDDPTNGWWDAVAASFDTTNNVITLRKPWNYANPKDANGIWKAGTKVAQVTNGSTYQYQLRSGWLKGQTGTTQWEYQSQEIAGFNLTGDSNATFRPATAYVTPLFLFNNAGTSTGDVTKVSNLYFEKI